MFEGILTALVTPFRNGGIDAPALEALCERQIKAGIAGIVVLGTTGEAATLLPDEQTQVIRIAVEVARGRVPIVAGASSNSTRAAVEQSERAAKAGAQALLHCAPYYNKPTQEGMYQHFVACARATKLPVILYNVPGRTASDLLPATVNRLATVPGIVAIKEATADLHRAGTLIRELSATFAVLSGDDFTAFPMFALGGKGVISVVSNVAPARMVEMWTAWKKGDVARAREIHLRLLPLMDLLFLESNPIPVKAALELQGFIGPDIREPLTPASASVREALSAFLQKESVAWSGLAFSARAGAWAAPSSPK
jgi:4-hydroxy-tetrahydrodipicolinate synthase